MLSVNHAFSREEPGRPIRRLETGDVGRDALPASVAKLPIVSVAAGAPATVRLLIAGASVDDGEVAENADHHVMLADVLDGGAATDLRQKRLAVDEGAVGVGVEEVGRQVGVEPGNIGFIYGPDVVAVELLQRSAVLLVVGHGLNSVVAITGGKRLANVS